MVEWTVDGGICMAVLERPERHNALDIDTVRALTDRLAVTDGPCPPLVLTGTGRTFCSGFDLTTWDEGLEFKGHADRLFRSLLSYPAPVIAALNGPAIGMGCVLAAMCDLRIGGVRSWFEVPAARLGVVLEEAYVAAIRDRLGLAAAQILMVGSRRIEPREAAGLGVLHALVDDPLSDARAWASHASGVDAESIAAHKAFINGDPRG